MLGESHISTSSHMSTNISIAHPTFHSRHLPYLHTPVHARPNHRPCRLQRIYVLRLQQNQGAICAKDTQPTVDDGAGHVPGPYYSHLLSLHLRPRQEVVKMIHTFFSLMFECIMSTSLPACTFAARGLSMDREEEAECKWMRRAAVCERTTLIPFARSRRST
jgi:hypothetical protein